VAAFPLGFHLGPLYFHLYGLGLAVAAFVAYEYAQRRLRQQGISTAPFPRFTAGLLVAGLIGARAANIATNWSYYQGHYGRWLAVWQGGLASFGGIALALLFGLLVLPQYWPGVTRLALADAIIPAVVAGWALGRVLGPQFMVNGGGHLSHQWFAMAYHGQPGKRVPVPLIQGAEDALLWWALVAWQRSAPRRGLVTGAAMTVWGLVRALDEHWLLGQESRSGSVGVQVAGVVLAFGGLVLMQRSRTRPRTARPV
jgi:phosphatidylglycerol:prolipoprotein diacylglycerol transferase